MSELTDLGNAQRFAKIAKDYLRFCPQLGWIIYEGKVWSIDQRLKVQDTAKAVIDELKGEYTKFPTDDPHYKEYRTFYLKSQSAGRIAAMIELAKPMLIVEINEFDKDNLLLNMQNGTLDLRTMVLKPYDKGDYITRVCSVAYNPEAKAPRWDKFLTEILPPDVARFLQT